MNSKNRRKEIEKYLLLQGKVDVEELVNKFHVSTMTIRRDLLQLERDNKIVRTHGGAVSTSGLINETAHSSKENKFLFEKKAIATEAANFISAGSTIFLDSGTTTLEVARHLKMKENITIITNDIFIALELINSNNQLLVTGGHLQNHIGAMLGSHTEALLQQINVDILLLGAHAVHPTTGITAPTLDKAKAKQLMIKAAKETWLIADSSKFNKKAFAKVCSLDDIDGIVTDVNSKKENVESYHNNVIFA
ncbi:DeoR/GlpR family DNA-binding transcription regulator [Evansella cellulosilytica]|uniref:Transcriptional regulator, DeoR family n=1 Tax=Evansella cellulosilytica (strain ATCC 21833 / DSM 2522 / FERM P-1141 / JCM 9156 / N-4) TaxID=649639 RepID=E6U0H1_EVAC2|nr:DeoR/GlpR family DNA-binding transcription regulator [Evansella cellulosilytica]ADU31416.1 transcriptional regulator, DeoR family [Evansella cellulosilytica DSM 2522]